MEEIIPYEKLRDLCRSSITVMIADTGRIAGNIIQFDDGRRNHSHFFTLKMLTLMRGELPFLVGPHASYSKLFVLYYKLGP
jgi:hypothetical protein